MNSQTEEFEFTESNITRIKALNDKLKKEEDRIRIFAAQLNINLKKQKEANLIDDFNFD